MTAQQRSERVQSASRRRAKESDGSSAASAKTRDEKKRSPEKRSWHKGTGAARRVAIVAACLVLLAVVILYPMGRTYYQTMRTEQRLQAQLDAVSARNDAVSAENDALQTQEGIESQAREDLGWVKEGEEGAIVTNEQSSTNGTSKLPEQVDESSISAPQTWYYAILDTIFFVHE